MLYDVVILTEDRYLSDCEHNWYNLQVLLEDELVKDALQQQGLKVARLSWSDPDFDWRLTRSAIFRTTWDYFDRFDEFKPWLDKVQQQTLLLNPAQTLLWNLNKRYLLDLQAKGINIVETHLLEQSDNLVEKMQQIACEQAIVKPLISGCARNTFKLDLQQAAGMQQQFEQLARQEGYMLQPFQHNICTEGELSLMVMGGKVTHAVQKVAKQGDFRVQDDHGGMVYPYRANAEEVAFAEAAIAACEPVPLYGRVDIVRDNNGKLAIMELELIEPELFFRFHRPATFKLAEAVKQKLQAS